jgi:hypothetical protein
MAIAMRGAANGLHTALVIPHSVVSHSSFIIPNSSLLEIIGL